MIQVFTNHRLAGLMPHSGASGLDAITDYFAYIALVSVAAGVAIVSLGFSANVAVGLLGTIIRPALLTESIALPALSKPSGVWNTTTRLAG